MFATMTAAGLLVTQQTSPQLPIFRSTSDSVPLFVSALDRSGRLVTELKRDDFTVLDNGKPQPITVFSDAPQPVRIVVLIDASGSMLGNLPLLRAATEELIGRLGPNDLARVGTFAGKDITISPEFSRDTAAIARWLPTEIQPNVGTPLWHAVDQAITTLSPVPEGRHVVLVLSDGKDSGPPKFGMKFLSQIEIGERAQREDVMIYGIGVYGSLAAARQAGAQTVRDMMNTTFPDPGLGTLALETGGGYFELRGRDDLGALFARVIEELHQQYLLGFVPPARDGKTHKIEVRVNRNDVKARVRKSYVAPK
jgi:VWFA-related protein